MLAAHSSDNAYALVKRRDWQIISLLGIVHSSSHFFQLVLPTLYLSLANEYGYDFASLGLLASVFFLVSCLGQASSGFVVDRIGPTPVLLFGLSGFVVSGVLMATSTGYGMLMLAAIVGGLGNSIFHPADYYIINHRISPDRLGHAFSTHGLTGYLGWALTPVFMATIIHFSNWRIAAFSAAMLLACVWVLAWMGRHLLSGKQARSVNPQPSPEDLVISAKPQETAYQTLRILVSKPALWGAFLFFAFTTVGLSAVQNYTIPMLGSVYGIDKVLAGTTLSAYMVTAALGMLAGGFLVGATPNTEKTVAVSLILAGLLLVVLASGVVNAPVAILLVGLAGFCAGVSAPSRDMLIRRITPKGSTGTVYGLVYSGMDVGSSVAPIGLGLLLDAGFDQGPWYGAALGFIIAAGLAIWVAKAATTAAMRSATTANA